MKLALQIMLLLMAAFHLLMAFSPKDQKARVTYIVSGLAITAILIVTFGIKGA